MILRIWPLSLRRHPYHCYHFHLRHLPRHATTMTTSAASGDDSPPPMILSYPQPKEGTGHLHVYGSKHASRLVLMCAGFPDDHDAFTPLARRLTSKNDKKDLDCLVGVTCLPGYHKLSDDDAKGDLDKLPKNGYTFPDWTASLREATKALRQHSTRPVQETQLVGVYHDWGVLAGLQFSNQVLHDENDQASRELQPNQLVIFDVCPAIHPKTPDKKELSATIKKASSWQNTVTLVRRLSYQVLLASLFQLQKLPVPQTVLYLYWSLVWTTMKWTGAFPAGPGDEEYLSETSAAHFFPHFCYKAYPYPPIVAAIFKGTIRSVFDGAYTPVDLVQTPVLYLYGAGKAYHLHHPLVEALLNREFAAGRPSKCVGMADSGHWLYRTHPDECVQEMQEFFDRCK